MHVISWINKLLSPNDDNEQSPTNALLGEEAIVVDCIPPGEPGKIKLHGIYWSAKSDKALQWSIPPNTHVLITDRQGLTLLVAPLPVIKSPRPSAVQLQLRIKDDDEDAIA